VTADDADDADDADATLLLRKAVEGDERAAEELLPLVYGKLRAIAGSLFKQERKDHTLQPTALVHEAWVKLISSGQHSYENRTQFLAIAAVAMRRLLVNHAETRGAIKRGGDRARVTLAEASGASHSPLEADVLALHEALEQLAEVNPRQAQVVELRWFGGLTIPEVSEHLAIAQRTVEKDWTLAKAWLRLRLSEDEASPAQDD